MDADGIIGPLTRKVVSLSTPDWLLARCIVRRSRFYADIIKSKPARVKYLNGWLTHGKTDRRLSGNHRYPSGHHVRHAGVIMGKGWDASLKAGRQ